jgi:hypothetical protein
MSDANLENIGCAAFRVCRVLGSITLPQSVVTIGDRSFMECVALAHIAFGRRAALRRIGAHSFTECHGLLTLTVPGKVGYVGPGALGRIPRVEWRRGEAMGSLFSSAARQVFSGAAGLSPILCLPLNPSW